MCLYLFEKEVQELFRQKKLFWPKKFPKNDGLLALRQICRADREADGF